jgi:hypothetical protein
MITPMPEAYFEPGKRADRIIGGVLALGIFLICTGAVPDVLRYLAEILTAVWTVTLLFRPSDIKGYGGSNYALRFLSSLNLRYALARVLEVATGLVAALVVWTGRERLPARIPVFDAKLIVSVVLSLVALGFLGAFAVSVSRGDPIEVRSQWGGLGGAGGGWRISRPMVCLMAAAVFGGLTALTNLSIALPEAPKAIAGTEAKATPEDANKGTSAVPSQKSTASPAGAASPEKK